MVVLSNQMHNFNCKTLSLRLRVLQNCLLSLHIVIFKTLWNLTPFLYYFFYFLYYRTLHGLTGLEINKTIWKKKKVSRLSSANLRPTSLTNSTARGRYSSAYLSLCLFRHDPPLHSLRHPHTTEPVFLTRLLSYSLICLSAYSYGVLK